MIWAEPKGFGIFSLFDQCSVGMIDEMIDVCLATVAGSRRT